MAQIKINNIIYGTNNAADILYKNITVEEKLDTIPVFDPSDNQNIEINSYDYLTYGHIIDSLKSDDADKVLSAKQGKVLDEKINNIDFSPLERDIEAVENKIDNFRVATTLTQAQYDNLSEEEKQNGIYVIKDEGNIFVAKNILYDGNNSGLGATVQQAIDKVGSKLPFEFGIDVNGNYGYKKVGADSVIPFFLGEVEYIATFTDYQNAVNLIEHSCIFYNDYKMVLVYMLINDTDNNGDNLMKCYSKKQTASSYSDLLNVNTDEWNYVKPTIVSNTSYPAINSKYTNVKNQNKDIYFATGTASANCFACIAYKSNVKKGESLYTYDVPYRRDLQMVIGIR